MFYQKKFHLYRLFSLHQYHKSKFEIKYWYVFAEDHNDIIDIHDKMYEAIDLEPNAAGHNVNYSGDRNMYYPNIPILQMLQLLIHFKGEGIMKNSHQLMVATYLGHNEISLEASTNLNQISSLIPTVTNYDKIWINDLSMKGTATYFIDMFEMKLWIAFFLIFLFIGMVSTLGIFLLRKFSKSTVDQINWYAILMNQGAEESSSFASRKFLLISLSLLAIIFHGAFEAFLSSYLAIRHPDLPFTDLTSLLKTKSYTICVFPFSSAFHQINYDIFKLKGKGAKVNSDACPNMFKVRDASNNALESSEKYCPLKNMVFIGSGECFIPEISSMCPLVPWQGKHFKKYVSMGVYPGFKYREQFNRGLIRLRTASHLEHLEMNFKRRQQFLICKYKMQVPFEEEVMEVEFSQITLLLLILMLGILCSLICLIVEVFYYKKFK